MADPRRPARVARYTPATETNPALEDPTPDYMNLLGMVFSMCGLMLKLKWCAWIAVYCSFISFANSRSSEDTKQMMSSFMLSISAVVMSYLQNPQPMSPPGDGRGNKGGAVGCTYLRGGALPGAAAGGGGMGAPRGL
ncbi:LOW QUALITY PROTEIN: PAT complex subunit Asterix [Podargus strigoides]